VSGRQLADPDLADLVCATVAESGLAAGSLILELTETVLMHDIGRSVAQLHALKAHEVQIAIDDFSRNLALDTIAEGIEGPLQWQRLRDFRLPARAGLPVQPPATADRAHGASRRGPAVRADGRLRAVGGRAGKHLGPMSPGRATFTRIARRR
jgi:EAL domain-containing protein (putative c-di-GMP-specific phosphodiesterase class I)